MESRRRVIKTDLTGKISSIVTRLKINEPLREHTTFRIGGPAKYLVDVNAVEQLIELWNLSRKENLSVMILGNGSNVLAGDHGYNGIVVRLTGDFSKYEFEGESVKCGAGLRIPVLINACAQSGFSGAEFLAGIPGSVGGALISNAGTREGCIGDIVSGVEILSGQGSISMLGKNDLDFSYRTSNLEKTIVTSARLNLKKAQKNDILSRIKDNFSNRLKTQPMDSWSAGSVFKNPQGESAGWLIEQAGLKGLKFGGAQISLKHANFIVNNGDAKASDVKSLITLIRSKVKEKFGIELELEIKIVGE